MKSFVKGALRYVAPLAAIVLISACTSDDRPTPLSGVNIAPPLQVAPQNNQNIENPTLTVANNFAVVGNAKTLVWSDEFDGPQLDPEVWFFETGDGSQYGIPGWGNNELEYYLPDNAQVANGMLTITARREQTGAFQYTSARINTRDRFAFKYGRIEARMRLPGGQGIWPAFWMLAQDSPYGGWAASGEIDIMEAVNLGGSGGNDVFGTIHYGGEFPANVFTGNTYLVPTDVTTEFHTYALEWDESEMRWYVDDTLYAVQNNWFSTAADFPAPFDHEFYILFNVAVGGNLPGSPDPTTIFPVTMEVDWVRVYSGEDPAAGGDEPGVAAPTPTADAANVISLFSDAYTDIAGIDYNPNWGQQTVVTQVDVAGNNTLKYAGLNYQGTDFAGNPQDVSGMDTLHLDFWTADSTALSVYLIDTNSAETAYALTIMPNTWVSVDIPLTEFAGVDLANVIQLKFDGNGTIFLDNIYFEADASPATQPAVAAPTPTADAANVISLFSDAYTDIAGIDYNPDWGQATVVTQVDIAGNNTLKYETLDYQGTDFAGNAQDVSGMDTLHLDFWTPDSTALNVSLISAGPVETAYALTINPGTWVSVDIPLTAFAPVDLTNVIQLKFDGNGTIFLDNIYFEASAAPATEPATAAPTPTADPANVISLFSDVYTNITGIDYNPNWGQATVVTQVDIAGNNTLKYAGLNYQGTDFAGNPQDVSGMDSFHLDFWTADSNMLNVYLISTDAAEIAYALTITPNTWVSVDIPLTAFAGVDLTSVMQLKFDGDGTIFLDNLYFEAAGAPATEPATAAPTPTADPGTVSSVFSDAYTAAGNFNYNPNWGQATVATIETIAGSEVWKLAGLNYQGIDFVEFGGPALDVSGYDTLHVDYWTADATAVNVFLISPGAETPYALPIATGSWQSVDIPLSTYSGVVDLTNVIQMKFDDAGTGEAATIFFDNMYFYTAGGGGGELAVNGGFETGDLSNWTLFPANAADPNEQTVVTTNPKTGTYAGRINNTTPQSASIIKQANLQPVSIGQTATVRFSARASFGVGGVAFAEFFTELSGGGTSSAQILGGGPLALNADPNVWTDFEYVIPISTDVSGGITLQLTGTTGGDAASFADVYYDDISIVVP